ncbi:hypothetical protein BJL95_05450 [Methylomonas sp. LWB]|uniref:NACHT domain-containing protein n=1 Tax=Methylomonas sp. LWB TaxID=1905845 RepID=UPI0008D8DBC3|nr:hypothetical protein [Methylomonas sp. LWB]OHX37469.1 hypothetical protein BJL95_05450 [Methylomonas sp. LWB]
MLFRVPRTVTEKTTEDIPTESRPIADYRDRPAYVLLGEPGAGKSTLFEDEADNTDDGYYISARDFIDLDNDEWREKTLFIDGLDEARAGKDDARTPLGAIRGKLNKLGCKRFRISCREADWLGALDSRDLSKISPVSVLYLDPLNSGDVEAILANDNRVGDADGFIETAERSGLSGLLENPQTLDMLIDAVKGGQNWPSTKQQLYRLTSEQLAAEFNDEHRVAEKSTVNIPALLDAVGLLCAIQLLANLSGFSEGYAQPGRVSLASIDLPAPTRAALKTRLFRKVGDEYSYVHRSVAEYLAAHFIAGKIKDDLLVNRVLTLTTGVDGGIVAALRGLMAWLAVLSESARDRLIEIDPLGLVVYGDVQLFSTQTKSRLLRALIREAQTTGFPSRDWHTTAFAAFWTTDLNQEILASFDKLRFSDSEQYLLYCLMQGLCYTESAPNIKPQLLAIIRNKAYWETTRSYALNAFCHIYPDDYESLLALAEDIHSKIVEDERNDLLEVLLRKLFLSKVKAAEIIRFIGKRPDSNRISCVRFWRKEFIQGVVDSELPDVLDEFFSIGTEKIHAAVDDLFDVAGDLLVSGITLHGSSISDERLYCWLSIGIDEYDECRLLQEHKTKISVWLEANPEKVFNLISEGLKRIAKKENIEYEISLIFERFRKAVPPKNLGVWWLNMALTEIDPDKRIFFFRQAFSTLYNQNSVLTLEEISEWVFQHPEFSEVFNELKFHPIPESWKKRIESKAKWQRQRKRELDEKLSFFYANLDGIAAGTAEPFVYDQISQYFDDSVSVSGKSNEQRLAEYLNDDDILIKSAKSGLRKILDRTDIPGAEEILAADVKNEYHYIRRPFLVCIESLYLENNKFLETLSDNLINSALAFCFTQSAFKDEWFKSLCYSRSDFVAKSYSAYITTLLNAKARFIHGISCITSYAHGVPIARRIVLPLLEKYPIRGYKDHIHHLKYLLKAAIAEAERIELRALIEKKLACKGMDLAQRIYWLATGLIIEPIIYETKIQLEVTDNAIRINHLSSFLLPRHGNEPYFGLERITTMGMLIALLAPRCQPNWPRGGGFVTRAMEERDYVRYLINNLAANPAEEAAKVLAELLEQPKLIAWHSLIRDAQQAQQISRREALYKRPDAFQVIETLNDRKPANVADLAVLALDCLQQLAAEMHGSSTNPYQHFWNLKGKNVARPKEPYLENDPRYEEVSRNYLADRLKPMLANYEVAVESEALQANEKRADMKLSFIHEGRSFYLPIEIKRDYHRDLWKTLHQQLIPRYTISPETEGRGLYLVLWFNSKKLPTHPQGLPPPKSATELTEMLKATLTPAERKLIDVFVLDVSATTPSKPS